MEDSYQIERTMITSMFLEEVYHEIEQDEFWERVDARTHMSIIRSIFSEYDEDEDIVQEEVA